MNINHVKNILIIALTVSSVYLTGQLWFEQISNRNFFYTFLSAFIPQQTVAEEERDIFIAPSSIITNLGGDKFSVLYNNILDSTPKKDCSEVLTKVLQRGQYVGDYELDWVAMLKNISYTYDYKIQLSSGYFAKSLLPNSSFLSKVKFFDQIMFIPSRGETAGIRVLFIDNKQERYFEYLVNDSQLNDRIVTNIQAQKGSQLVYKSSKQTGLKMFHNNIFIPQIPSDGYEYPVVTIENPYYDGDLLLDTLEKEIDVFFKNPASKWSGLTNEIIYTFVHEDTVVKYYPNDILEYSNYSVIHNRTTQVFTNNYYAALRFIKSDTAVTNEYFLADYKEGNDRQTFYFDYALNNLPVLLSDTMRTAINMQHAIEVTVESEHVTKYKKLAYTFHIDMDNQGGQVARLDFVGAVNSMVAMDLNEENTNLEDAGLGYKVDNSMQASLYWFIDINGKAYVKSTQMAN